MPAEMHRHHDESSRKLFREALSQAHGDVIAAAHKLGMSRATLYRKLKKYGMTGVVSSARHGITSETDS